LKKLLVAGWFSFEDGHATAGDLLARDVACRWVAETGFAHDVAYAPPFGGDVELDCADPRDYSLVVFVCGPFGRGELEGRLLSRFSRCRIIGLDLTMLEPLDAWNPFDTLLERDSSVTARPDVVFASRQPLVPVVGVCLVEPYEGASWDVAHAAIDRLVASREMAAVPIDTRLDANTTGLRTPAEIESVLARMDVVVTTRLHAMVFAIKNGVPALAIDPEAGGAKIRRQAEVIGWPVVLTVDSLTDRGLQEAFAFCLTPEARAKARECFGRTEEMLRGVKDDFLAALRDTAPPTGRDRDPKSWVGRPASTTGSGPDTSSRPARRRVMAEGTRLLKRLARRALPSPLRRSLRVMRAAARPGGAGAARPFGWPRQLRPVSREWGFDRGLPIDRHYIEAFLSRHAADIRGRVLEIGDDAYTRRFGGRHVTGSDVLNVAGGDPATTIVADLSRADHIPSESFDCIILTQTLHLIYDVQAAIGNLRRILKPGGVLLATFPGITRISVRELPGSWYWSFTTHSAKRLFGASFPARDLAVESYGNVLVASAFLYGLAASDLEPEELNRRDPEYELLVEVRAVRGEEDGR
jgi:SAM-dependent methyltransferase